MIINKEEIIKNKNIILIIISVIFIFIISSLFFNNKSNTLYEKELSQDGDSKINKLVINEYMSSNNGLLVDENGEIYDWIELYNGTNSDINLRNYGLSDNKNNVKWIFPDVVIKAKSHLIVYLAGKNKSGLYAPFKLKSSGGETLALKTPGGKVVDIINTVSLTSSESAARDLNGEFIITDTPTPGYQNTKEGYESLKESLKGTNNGIRISEVLPKNDGNFSINSKYPSYVEIVNTSDDVVSLDGYYISNDINKLYKYKIENVELKKDEVYVIYTGNNTLDKENTYLNFSLDNKYGNVYLLNKEGKIIDTLEYEALPNGVAKVLIDNEYYETSVISPGYINNSEGVKNFQDKYSVIPKTLIINEVMSNNTSYLAQNGYNFYDWIELYNNSNETINLSDYYLTTTNNNPSLYKLPDVKLKPKEYYVIMASGNTNLTNNTYYHANFKISDTEAIYLYKGKKIIDSILINDIPLNYSYGRGLESGLFYMENPTPLKQNKVGERELSFAPIFSLEAGIYNNVDNINVELKSIGNIYYTLDGSTPNKNSKKYNSPIELKKTTVLKAVTIENGKIKSDVITSTYIINENHTLPVLSISLNPSDLNRVLYNPSETIEVGANLELFEENSSFNIPCGLSLLGGMARQFSKKSFGIRFKSKYGAGSLNYKLFDNRDTMIYQSIALRSGSQDVMTAGMRDMVGTSLVDEYTDIDVQAYKIAILYINGNYYGIYSIREKVNADFIANHYNVDPTKTNLLQGISKMQSGSRQFYENIINYVRTHNMLIDSNYEKLKDMVDVQNIIDYWIAQIYIANHDIINIRYFNHPDIDNGKMKMIFFDLDFSFQSYTSNYFTYITNPEGISVSVGTINTDLMRLCLRNLEFRELFLERLKYNLENTWKVENVIGRIDEIYNKLLPEMERNQKRWYRTLSDFKKEVESLKKFAKERDKYIKSQAKSYFKLSNEEYDKYFGGIK